MGLRSISGLRGFSSFSSVVLFLFYHMPPHPRAAFLAAPPSLFWLDICLSTTAWFLLW